MARIEVILSGSPVSEIRSSLNKNQILSNDLFYISQQQLSNVSPDRTYDSGTTTYNNQFKSTKMSYDTLSNMMLERFIEYANFGSMAWESSSDYSFVKHTHNYSKVEITSHNKPTDNEGQMLSIASFQIDHTIKKVLWMAKPKEYHMPEPSIGQLKFLALTSIPNVNEAASDFDGWTWPDGRTIQNTNGRFARAAAYFGSSETASDFALPNLTSFIRPAKLADASIGTPVSQRVVVPKHPHEVSTKVNSSSTIQFDVKFDRGNKVRDDTACHAANNKSATYFEFPCWFDITNLNIVPTSDHPISNPVSD